LFLHDLTRAELPEYAADDQVISSLLSAKLSANIPVIDIWNKADALACTESHAIGLTLSAKTGEGLEALRSKLLEVAGWQPAAEGIYSARERHVQALQRVDIHLSQAAEHLAAQAQSLDLLAEELRLGQNALSEVTGEFTSDDLLGVIFSSFCIGK
jgi:tRNA modification GTPase